MINYSHVKEINSVQNLIAQLEEKGWSLTAIAESDKLKIHRNTITLWKAGTRYPRPDMPVIDALTGLIKIKPPKKRRYVKGSRLAGGDNNGR